MKAKKPLDDTPIPYTEPPEGSKEHFWDPDPWDANLPSTPGFISDFVAHMRGYETPTAYCMWAAIFYLSSVIKREAWIEWGYSKLYSNFYILLIGPPGIVKKGTAMEEGYEVFHGSRAFISDRNLKEVKRFNVLRNKASPEALVTVMAENRKKHGEAYDFVDQQGNTILVKGKPYRYNRTSEISIIVPELATMLSRADYARPTTTLLMDLYDCKNSWEVTTQARGRELLTNTFTNFFGGVTPKGLATSIPEEASEDGFLSRCVLMYQRGTDRCFDEPSRTGPDREDLSRKMAWIAQNTMGQHNMNPDAKAFYKRWYRKWRKDLESAERPYASSRMAVQALQLSLILKASRFARGTTIEERDISDATRIMECTASTYRGLFDRVDNNAFFNKLGVVERRIRSKGKITRRALLTSSRNTAEELSSLLNHLYQTGKIRIFNGRQQQTYISKDGGEEYRWVSGQRPTEEDRDGEV